MNIKNVEYAKQKEKRDRAIDYWQNKVILNHLPPIDIKKKKEMLELKKQTTTQSRGGNKPYVHIGDNLRK